MRSIKTTARFGGILYLIIIVAGIFGELFVRNKLIVSGDATATANNIMSSQLLWRIGIAGDLIMHVCDVPLALIFYILLKPVNKNLFTPLFLLGSADYLKSFEPHQLQALSYVSIRLDGYGFGIGLIFFGFACLVLGYLIIRSSYLPRVIGVLMQIAGFCYITNSFALILAPKFADMLFPAIMVPPF